MNPMGMMGSQAYGYGGVSMMQPSPYMMQ